MTATARVSALTSMPQNTFAGWGLAILGVETAGLPIETMRLLIGLLGAMAKSESMYPETIALKSTRPSESGDLVQNSTGHGDSGFALKGGLERGFSPSNSFHKTPEQLHLVQPIGLRHSIARCPIAALMALQPAQRAALLVDRAFKRAANLVAQGQCRSKFFHGQTKHDRQQAQHAQQVLFGRVRRA